MTAFHEVPAETIAPGTYIDDERYSHVMLVGHVTIGPKRVTARAFHPEANVYPKTAYRFPRGSKVRVAIKEDP